MIKFGGAVGTIETSNNPEIHPNRTTPSFLTPFQSGDGPFARKSFSRMLFARTPNGRKNQTAEKQTPELHWAEKIVWPKIIRQNKSNGRKVQRAEKIKSRNG